MRRAEWKFLVLLTTSKVCCEIFLEARFARPDFEASNSNNHVPATRIIQL
jgi:hypothetical protein